MHLGFGHLTTPTSLFLSLISRFSITFESSMRLSVAPWAISAILSTILSSACLMLIFTMSFFPHFFEGAFITSAALSEYRSSIWRISSTPALASGNVVYHGPVLQLLNDKHATHRLKPI